MNARHKIMANYKVDEHGIIRSPGQFEGEKLYVPYFWEAYLNGCADRDDGLVLGFDVNADDLREFPELKGRRTVRLMQSDDGFVVEV
jgi:hypothetical protein